LTRPSQQRLWLDNKQRLLPGSYEARQQDEEHAVCFGIGRPFHLSSQDDHLLAQQGVFCHQLGLATGLVSQRRKQQRGGVGCGPGDEAVVQPLKAITCQPFEKGENPRHSRRSPMVKISK